MNFARRAQRAWHLAKGLLAHQNGDYLEAVRRFDLVLAAARRSTCVLGYRAICLMLLGRKQAALAAFQEVAGADKSEDPDDEYARLWGKMYLAFLHDELDEADRIAEKLAVIQCRWRKTRRILVPIEKPSTIAADLKDEDPPEKTRALRLTVRAHFATLGSAYGTKTIRPARK